MGMNVFAFSFAVMLALVLVERLVLVRLQRGTAPWQEVVLNLNSGHILMWVFRGVEVAAFAWVLQHASLHWVSRWPVVLQWGFALLAWDLCFYWMHRLHHRWPLLWAVHSVHHEGEHFGLSLGVRNSWFSSLSNFPFVLPLAVLGVPLEVFVVVSSLHYGVQFYNHNALVGRSGWLDRWLVTPSNHRVHHGTHAAYIDKNFGGTFLLWDKLFGSYQAERDDIPLQYGVVGRSVKSYNPLWANLRRWQPLRAAHTGALAQQLASRWAASDRYAGSGGVLLFALVIGYVAHAPQWAGAMQVLVFALIFAGTLALGAWSDRQPAGWVAWAVLPALAAGVLGAVALSGVPTGLATSLQHTTSPWLISLFGAWTLHALAGLWPMGQAQPRNSGTTPPTPPASPTLPPVRFAPAHNSAFRHALHHEAQAYLAQQGTHRWGNAAVLLKACALLLAMGVAYASALGAHSPLQFGLAYVSFLVLAMGLAMNTLHDAAHMALCRTPWLNHWIKRLVSVPVGIDADYWTIRHVGFHHHYANVEGYDLDIEPNPFLRQTPFHAWAPQYRWQHLYWPLVAALSLPYLCWYSDWIDRLGRTPVAAHTPPPWGRFLLTKLAHMTLVLVLPMYAMAAMGMGWYAVLGWYLAGQMLASCVLVALVLGTHWADVQFFKPDAQGRLPHDWYQHTFYTSCDWLPRPAGLGYWLGGLNLHLTHHLLPTYSHRHYPALSRIVQRLAAEHDLPYRQLSYGALARAQQRFLKAMGRG
jgi:linoleoyl-CoA desaturase